ncbi:sulfatase-like hydrolase/transferase [candidate division KSB1 bacterium]|nr:sulfatase-like hydrolase/transferase [candidate division KSB1 bacterium]
MDKGKIMKTQKQDKVSFGKVVFVSAALTGASVGFLDLIFTMTTYRPVPFSSFWTLFPPLLSMALVGSIFYLIAVFFSRAVLAGWLRDRNSAFAFSFSLFVIFFFFLLHASGLTQNVLSRLFSFRFLAVLFVSVLMAFICFLAVAQKQIFERDWMSVLMALTLFLANLFLYVWVITFISTSVWLNIPLFLVFIAVVVIEIRASFTHDFFVLYPSLLFLFFILFSAIDYSQSADFSRVGGGETVNPGPKYIILLTVDTLRPDFISAYGKRDNYTPNMDQLASDGILFENVYSASPWTLSSFASIMTGMPPSVHMTKTASSRLPDTLSTLAELLQQKGYKTAGIGRNQFLTEFYNLSQGFDEYYFYPKAGFGESLGMKLLHKLFGYRTIDVNSFELTDMTMRWLRGDDLDPFFLWIHYFDPHMPYTPPQKFLPRAQPPKGLGFQFNDFAGVRRGYFYPDQHQAAWIAELYAAEVRYVDECLGSVVDLLKKLKIYDESLLIFSSDHGEEFWEHGRFEHGHSIYNEQIRVPLIIKPPVSDPVQTSHVRTTVSLMSLFPTILDYAGIERHPVGTEIESLRPLLSGAGSDKPCNPLFSEALLYYEDQESVILDRYKCIHYLQRDIYELYDLESDPGEMHSLADTSPELLQLARQQFQSFHQRCDSVKAEYGIEKGENLMLDKSAIESLRSLGYIR